MNKEYKLLILIILVYLLSNAQIYFYNKQFHQSLILYSINLIHLLIILYFYFNFIYKNINKHKDSTLNTYDTCNAFQTIIDLNNCLEILSLCKEIIIILDEELNITFTNHFTEQALGYNQTELKYLPIKLIVQESDYNKIYKYYLDLVTNNKNSTLKSEKPINICFITKDEKPLEYECLLLFAIKADKKPICVIISISEIIQINSIVSNKINFSKDITSFISYNHNIAKLIKDYTYSLVTSTNASEYAIAIFDDEKNRFQKLVYSSEDFTKLLEIILGSNDLLEKSKNCKFLFIDKKALSSFETTHKNELLNLPSNYLAIINLEDKTNSLGLLILAYTKYLDYKHLSLLEKYVQFITFLLFHYKYSEQFSKMQNYIKLSEKLKIVSQLSAAIAHEYNNIINAILASSEMLLSEIINSPYLHTLEEIIKCCQLATNFTNNFLTLAKQNFKIAKLNMHKVILSIEKEIQVNYKTNFLSLCYKFEANSDNIWGNEELLKLAIINIINSITSINQNTKTIYIQTINIEINENDSKNIMDLYNSLIPLGNYILTSISPNLLEDNPKSVFLDHYQNFYKITSCIKSLGNLKSAFAYSAVSLINGYLFNLLHKEYKESYIILLHIAENS